MLVIVKVERLDQNRGRIRYQLPRQPPERLLPTDLGRPTYLEWEWPRDPSLPKMLPDGSFA